MGKALVVDDNEINAMLAAEILDACGVNADIADSGVQALESVRIQDYPFILMDYIMPGMDGIEATREILKIKPNAVVYAMTGDLNDELRTRFKEAGAKGTVSKPLVLDELIDVVIKHMKPGTYHLPKSSDRQKALENDAEEQVLKALLSDVAGLNFERGVSNSLGNFKAYLRILKASVGNIRQYVDIMSEYKPGMEVTQLKISFHSLKSVFGNIGMDFMRNESDSMEILVNRILAEGDSSADSRSRLERELAGYISTATDTAMRLENVIAEYDARTIAAIDPRFYEVPEEALSPEEYKEVSEHIFRMLDTCEVERLTEGLGILIKATTGDARRSLEQAIKLTEEFDYDGIRRIVDSVINA